MVILCFVCAFKLARGGNLKKKTRNDNLDEMKLDTSWSTPHSVCHWVAVDIGAVDSAVDTLKVQEKKKVDSLLNDIFA